MAPYRFARYAAWLTPFIEEEIPMKTTQLLLVDDDTEFQESMSTALEKRGFEVTLAPSGSLALQLIEEKKFDIAVLDLKMPGLSGIETLSLIRERNNPLPVVILTGHGALNDAICGIDLGIVDFINKPVSPDDLSTRIEALLGKQQILRERRTKDVLVPPSRFGKLYLDESVSRVVEIFSGERGRAKGPTATEPVLVFDRGGTFLGIITMRDLIDSMSPVPFRYAVYTTYLTGMFLAQCVLLEKMSVRDLIGTHPAIDLEMPLMQAVHMLLTSRSSALPVLSDGIFVGVIRERDVIAEIIEVLARGDRPDTLS
jgi:CheY-like chemotaxis protein